MDTCDCQRCAECIIKHADQWVRQRFQYESEDVETIQTPDRMLETLQEFGKMVGDCDDCTTLLASIYKTMGFPVRLVAIRTRANVPDYLHVFLEVWDQTRWIGIDPTVQPNLKLIHYGRMEVTV